MERHNPCALRGSGITSLPEMVELIRQPFHRE